MNISEKEFESVVNADAKTRYEYCIKKIVDWEEIWILNSTDGFALLEDSLGEKYIPIFPAKEYAKNFKDNNWENYKPMGMDLEEFINDFLSTLSKDGISISVFPTRKNSGLVNTVKGLINDINIELENY